MFIRVFIALALSIVSFSAHKAWADNSCSSLFSSQISNSDTRDSVFTKLLTGEGTNEVPDLMLSWKVNNPDNSPKALEYFANPFDETGRVFYSVSRFAGGHPAVPMKFYEEVYKNYEDRIKNEIIALVQKVDATLPLERESYGVVETNNEIPRTIVGTMRVFDGRTEKQKTSAILPFEAAFNARNIPVTYIKKLEQLRKENSPLEIFEIGKLTLEGTPALHERSLKAMELFLYTYYVSKYPNATMLVHVASEAHLKLYQKRYGFKIEETVSIPKSEQKEYILTISAKEFGKALEKRLGL